MSFRNLGLTIRAVPASDGSISITMLDRRPGALTRAVGVRTVRRIARGEDAILAMQYITRLWGLACLTGHLVEEEQV